MTDQTPFGSPTNAPSSVISASASEQQHDYQIRTTKIRIPMFYKYVINDSVSVNWYTLYNIRTLAKYTKIPMEIFTTNTYVFFVQYLRETCRVLIGKAVGPIPTYNVLQFLVPSCICVHTTINCLSYHHGG